MASQEEIDYSYLSLVLPFMQQTHFSDRFLSVHQDFSLLLLGRTPLGVSDVLAVGTEDSEQMVDGGLSPGLQLSHVTPVEVDDGQEGQHPADRRSYELGGVGEEKGKYP